MREAIRYPDGDGGQGVSLVECRQGHNSAFHRHVQEGRSIQPAQRDVQRVAVRIHEIRADVNRDRLANTHGHPQPGLIEHVGGGAVRDDRESPPGRLARYDQFGATVSHRRHDAAQPAGAGIGYLKAFQQSLVARFRFPSCYPLVDGNAGPQRRTLRAAELRHELSVARSRVELLILVANTAHIRIEQQHVRGPTVFR